MLSSSNDKSSERSTFTAVVDCNKPNTQGGCPPSSDSSLSSSACDRTVRFSEQVQVHKDNHETVDMSIRWYTTQELKEIKVQAKETVESIIRSNSQQRKWALHQTSLQGAYELYEDGLLDYNDKMVRWNANETAAHRIGLHCLAAYGVLGGRTTTAHASLWSRLQDLEGMTDVEQRARLQAQASACASHASRLYAAQLGHWWAAHNRFDSGCHDG